MCRKNSLNTDRWNYKVWLLSLTKILENVFFSIIFVLLCYFCNICYQNKNTINIFSFVYFAYAFCMVSSAVYSMFDQNQNQSSLLFIFAILIWILIYMPMERSHSLPFIIFSIVLSNYAKDCLNCPKAKNCKNKKILPNFYIDLL